MKAYLDTLRHILDHGKPRTDRTGTGTLGVFGYQTRYDLRSGFPLLTTKKMFTKGIIHELLWFLSGDTHVKYLQNNGVKIWDEWATKEQTARFNRTAGDLGPIYSKHWRNFGAKPTVWRVYDAQGELRQAPGFQPGGVDQIANLVRDIKDTPDSRRLIVSAWDPRDATQVALPACHTFFQCSVQDAELNLHLYQRSADVFLGVPFNIASYALLTLMLAQVTGLKPGELVHSFGDLHIYNNHFEQVQLQLTRDPRPLPTMTINPDVKSLFDFKYDDFKLSGYCPHPAIKAEIAV